MVKRGEKSNRQRGNVSTPIERTITTYNKIAKQWNKDHYNPNFWAEEFKVFQNLVHGRKIIDIGCGAGRDAVFFVNNGFDYTGIDASAGMLDEARKRLPKAKFVLMDFNNLDFPDETFDGFWASASLLHSPKDKVGQVLQNIRKVIKPNGVGFISIKEKKLADEEIVKDEDYGNTERYFAFYEKEEFQKILEESGFAVIRAGVHRMGSTGWLCYFVRKN